MLGFSVDSACLLYSLGRPYVSVLLFLHLGLEMDARQHGNELSLAEREELEMLRKENDLFRRRVKQLESSVASVEMNSARRSEDPEMEELHDLIMKANVRSTHLWKCFVCVKNWSLSLRTLLRALSFSLLLDCKTRSIRVYWCWER
jgi:hypothetical protein